MFVLENSAKLRLATVFLFYFSQGVAVGLFVFAIPAWLAANGASTVQIASLVGTTLLPWSFKFVMGFVIDRYTYLPMGRRRGWIITAQSTIVAVLVTAAIVSPGPDQIWLLSLLGFLTSAGTAIQDVSIDSLAVDILEETERAKAGGVMFGAQTLGISATTFAASQLIALHGIGAGYIVAALVVAIVMAFGVLMREREGEKRFPWSPGASHPRNTALQSSAWKPLLLNSAKAMLTPPSLLAIIIVLFSSTQIGIYDAFNPRLATGIGGWTQTGYTNTIASAQLFSAMIALTVGGWAISKVGAQRACLFLALLIGSSSLAFGLARDSWQDPTLLTFFFWYNELVRLLFGVAIVPIAMRLCHPAVAAVQFTLYMSLSNFGRPLGNAIAAFADDIGRPEMMYFILATIFAMISGILYFSRFPTKAPAATDLFENRRADVERVSAATVSLGPADREQSRSGQRR